MGKSRESTLRHNGIDPSEGDPARTVEAPFVERIPTMPVQPFPHRIVAIPSLVLAMALSMPAFAATCFVKETGDISNDGASWSTPLDLSSALLDADCDEIRVARGLYKPPSNGAGSFDLRAGVEVYGGFEGTPGTESDFAGRDPQQHATVLSGDIGNDDIVDANGVTADADDIRGVNATLFKLNPTGRILADTVLDGFIFTGSLIAVRCNALSPSAECSPTFRNITWVGNHRAIEAVAQRGGKVAFAVRDSTIMNSAPRVAFEIGGAMSLGTDGGSAWPVFENVTFSNNRAAEGGVLYTWGGYGVMEVAFRNVTMVGNSATNKGGALALYGVDVVMVRIVNSIIWGNTAPEDSQIHSPGVVSLFASIVEDLSCRIFWSCQDISGADPQLGPLQFNGGFGPTMLPALTSPAIDTANNEHCTATDQRGIARPHGGGCDMGAVENVELLFRNGFELQAAR